MQNISFLSSSACGAVHFSSCKDHFPAVGVPYYIFRCLRLTVPGAHPAVGGRLPVHLRRRVLPHPTPEDGDEHSSSHRLRPRRAPIVPLPPEIRQGNITLYIAYELLNILLSNDF